MKLSIALSTTFLLSTQARRLNVEFTNDCNLANVLEVTGDELYDYIPEANAEAKIEELCQIARDNNSNPRKGACEFSLHFMIPMIYYLPFLIKNKSSSHISFELFSIIYSQL